MAPKPVTYRSHTLRQALLAIAEAGLPLERVEIDKDGNATVRSRASRRPRKSPPAAMGTPRPGLLEQRRKSGSWRMGPMALPCYPGIVELARSLARIAADRDAATEQKQREKRNENEGKTADGERGTARSRRQRILASRTKSIRRRARSRTSSLMSNKYAMREGLHGDAGD